VAFDPLRRRTPAGHVFRPLVTQGALVSGLRLPRYGSGSYFGFLITARCDLAHIRTDTVNLLPIVPVREWLDFDGAILILLGRLLTLEEKFADACAKLPEGLQSLIKDDWSEGFELFVKENADVDKQAKVQLEQIIEEASLLRQVLPTCAQGPAAIARASASYPAFQKLLQRERQKKLQALLENKISDCHFLPVVRTNESLSEAPGYVILFRQILSVSGTLLDPLSSGIAAIDALHPDLRAHAEEVLAPPSELLANVQSPHVESILQRFANLFARVGVEDSSEKYKSWLANRLCGGG